MDDPKLFGPPEIKQEEIEYVRNEKYLLGKGAFGSVFRGKCRGKEVAIKILDKDVEDRDVLAEFWNEVVVATRIHHPNVVLTLGACLERGCYAIISELVNGGTLKELLHNDTRQSTDHYRLTLARGIACGMNWLHCLNPPVIHRDLKPANVLIDKGIPKVADFGLSDILRGSSVRDKSRKGSLIWMSPEVMRKQAVTIKADVYSFGIMLWEMYTLLVPFDELTYDEMEPKICGQNYRPQIPPDMPPALAKLIRECWDANPEKRPAFKDIIDRLDNIIVDILFGEGSLIGNLWKLHYKGLDVVKWDDFFPKFFAIHGETRVNSKDIRVLCLRDLIAEKENDESQIEPKYILHLFNLAKFVIYFQPITKPKQSIISCFTDLAQYPWFFGDITSKQAEDFLKAQKEGSYLVRFSSRNVGFTMSLKTSSGKPLHVNIDFDGSQFSVPVVTGSQKIIVSSTSIPGLIRDGAKTLKLEQPCPGSMFQKHYISESSYGGDNYGFAVQ